MTDRELYDEFRLKADEYAYAKRRVEEIETNLAEDRENLVKWEAAQKWTQETISSIQKQIHESLCTVTTKCLNHIYGEKYKFYIDFEKKRNTTEARAYLKKGKMVIDIDSESISGGVVEIISFALRVTALLKSPHLRRLLVLDEPFRVIAKEYQKNIAEMLQEISDELDIQFLIVTHEADYEIGKVVELE